MCVCMYVWFFLLYTLEISDLAIFSDVVLVFIPLLESSLIIRPFIVLGMLYICLPSSVLLIVVPVSAQLLDILLSVSNTFIIVGIN